MIKEWAPQTENCALELPRHVVYLPPEYETQPDKRWPLLIFLHGAGERGEDFQAIYRHGPFREIREGRDFPFVVIAPQISGVKFWACYSQSLNHMLDGWLKDYRIDASRVYLTGLSMGGTGTWMWGMMNPERFAAIMPLCGTGIVWCAGNLREVPVWAFHGDLDDTVPVGESERMVESLQKCGGDAKLTICTGAGHDCWTETYHRTDIYEWLLAHHK